MLSRLILLSLALVSNIIHLFIPARVINTNFDPILSFLSLGFFLGIIHFISSLKRDWVYILLILISYFSQVASYYKSGGGVPDYINLFIFDSNIPDFFITLTILTWWYSRVYKGSKFIPAKIEQDGL